MAHLVLGVTGSVASIRVPSLYDGLRDLGHAVRVVATEPSLHFFDANALGPPDAEGGPVFRDRDEWASGVYERDSPILHIALRGWADALVVAPLDANTLAKFALGLADNLLTSLFRAWDFAKPVVLAPAMNTLMWESPVTLRTLRTLLEDRGDGGPSHRWSLDEAPAIFEVHAPGLVLIPPQSKRLACGDVGMGAMAEVSAVCARVAALGFPTGRRNGG